MSKNSESFKLGRNAKTGRFVPVDVARKNPDRYEVEHIPKAGRGDVPKSERRKGR